MNHRVKPCACSTAGDRGQSPSPGGSTPCPHTALPAATTPSLPGRAGRSRGCYRRELVTGAKWLLGCKAEGGCGPRLLLRSSSSSSPRALRGRPGVEVKCGGRRLTRSFLLRGVGSTVPRHPEATHGCQKLGAGVASRQRKQHVPTSSWHRNRCARAVSASPLQSRAICRAAGATRCPLAHESPQPGHAALGCRPPTRLRPEHCPLVTPAASRPLCPHFPVSLSTVSLSTVPCLPVTLARPSSVLMNPQLHHHSLVLSTVSLSPRTSPRALSLCAPITQVPCPHVPATLVSPQLLSLCVPTIPDSPEHHILVPMTCLSPVPQCLSLSGSASGSVPPCPHDPGLSPASSLAWGAAGSGAAGLAGQHGHGHCWGMIHRGREQMYGCLRRVST